jgi:hypothetical protein
MVASFASFLGKRTLFRLRNLADVDALIIVDQRRNARDRSPKQ